MPALDASIRIGAHPVSSDSAPYVIAEIGSNHDQSLDRALELVAVAADAGASAAKFQLYRAADLVHASHPARSVLEATELSEDWLPALRSFAAELGIDLLASSFSPGGARLLETHGVVAHKVASSEAMNIALLATLSRSRLPVLLSLGMCSWVDVETALEVLTTRGKRDIVLLQCTSLYPLPTHRANLHVIPQLIARYGGVVGFSDHTESLTSGGVAIGMGARVIEKHITWSRTADGPDHGYALEPEGFRRYCAAIREAVELLGGADRVVEPEETVGRRRLGLYATTPIRAGDTYSWDNLEMRGPLTEVPGRHQWALLGVHARRDIASGEALSWDDV